MSTQPTAQQGGSTTPTPQQPGQQMGQSGSAPPQQQGGQTVFRDWASI